MIKRYLSITANAPALILSAFAAAAYGTLQDLPDSISAVYKIQANSEDGAA